MKLVFFIFLFVAPVVAQITPGGGGITPNVQTTGFTRTLLDDPDASTARATLGIAAAGGLGVFVSDTATAARSIATTSGNKVLFTKGQTVKDDGGHALYLWDATAVNVDDGLTVLTPDDSPAAGRWIRYLIGGGAVGGGPFPLTADKTNVTTDQTDITADQTVT